MTGTVACFTAMPFWRVSIGFIEFQSQLLFQIAPIERPLISVAQLGRTGHRVTFEGSKGCVEHIASGRRIALERSGNVYTFRMLVPGDSPAPPGKGSPSQTAPANAEPGAGFSGRGR